MLFQFDWRYAAIALTTIAAYLAYTAAATNWRIGIRRSMNESDSDANAKAIDIAAQLRDGQIFLRGTARDANGTTARWRATSAMSVKSYVSLAVLNFGQAFIYTSA